MKYEMKSRIRDLRQAYTMIEADLTSPPDVVTDAALRRLDGLSARAILEVVRYISDSGLSLGLGRPAEDREFADTFDARH